MIDIARCPQTAVFAVEPPIKSDEGPSEVRRRCGLRLRHKGDCQIESPDGRVVMIPGSLTERLGPDGTTR